jgi:aspartate/methionine/tyrosine aminotransferase
MRANAVFPLPTCATRWKNFQTSIFSTMTHFAQKYNAVNLAQGFPDFEGPEHVLNLVKKHFESQAHQYAPSIGDAVLREAVSLSISQKYDVSYSPNSEVTITAGATEAIYCVVNALVNPGESVVVFEPFYDSYAQAIAQAGGVLKPVRLHAPGTFDNETWQPCWETLESYKFSSPKLLILNSPHNPTGKMFSETELAKIADFVFETGCFVMCDEVYEHLVFENKEHVSLIQFEKIRSQVIRVSSAAKTFGFTGFKVGWVCAHEQVSNAIRLVHQATVFSTPRFLQSGIADALNDSNWYLQYLKEFKNDYASKRDILVKGLKKNGFVIPKTFSSYFVMANYESILPGKQDVEAATWFMENKRVAAIPPSAFYVNAPKHLPWLRFAFCKKVETLTQAMDLLSAKA